MTNSYCNNTSDDRFKNFHTKCSRNYSGNYSRKIRQKYYDGNVLCIRIGEKTFRYPPKGGVILFNEDKSKVLMVRNNYHPWVQCQKWGLPKGHCDDGETYNNCAKRELREETGLTIDVLRNDKYITINNSRYFAYCIKGSMSYSASPLDTKEINKVEFQSPNVVGSIKMNKEALLMLTKKITLARQIARDIII